MSRPTTIEHFELVIYIGIGLDVLASLLVFNRDLPIMRAHNVDLNFVLGSTGAAYVIFFVAAWVTAHKRSNVARFLVVIFVVLASFKPRNFNVATGYLQQRDFIALPYILAAVVQVIAVILLFQAQSNMWFRRTPAPKPTPQRSNDASELPERGEALRIRDRNVADTRTEPTTTSQTGYYTLISRAVAKLPHNTDSMRRSLYDRARQAVARQLEANGDERATVQSELDALEQAIRRFEGETSKADSEVRRAVETPAPAAMAAVRRRFQRSP